MTDEERRLMRAEFEIETITKKIDRLYRILWGLISLVALAVLRLLFASAGLPL